MHEDERLGRPEQFIEDVAKPRLEHVHLAFGDGHLLRPVVDDAPADKTVLHRPPRSAIGREQVIVKVRRDRSVVKTPRPARCARTAHLQEVGRAGTRRNDRQLVGAESAATQSNLVPRSVSIWRITSRVNPRRSERRSRKRRA